MTKRRAAQDSLAAEIEKIQDGLRQSIEETKRLSETSQALLDRRRKEEARDKQES